MCARPLPDIEGLEEIQALLHHAIQVMEELYCADVAKSEAEAWLPAAYLPDQSPRRVRLELLGLLESPWRWEYANQMIPFWRLVEDKEDRIIVFCRDRSPVANLIFAMTGGGSRFSADFVAGRWDEIMFPVLTRSAGILSCAQVRFCDVREPDAFLRMLFETHEHFDCAMCDWELEPEEIRAIARLTKQSRLAFLLPEPGARVTNHALRPEP